MKETFWKGSPETKLFLFRSSDSRLWRKTSASSSKRTARNFSARLKDFWRFSSSSVGEVPRSPQVMGKRGRHVNSAAHSEVNKVSVQYPTVVEDVG